MASEILINHRTEYAVKCQNGGQDSDQSEHRVSCRINGRISKMAANVLVNQSTGLATNVLTNDQLEDRIRCRMSGRISKMATNVLTNDQLEDRISRRIRGRVSDRAVLFHLLELQSE